MGEKSGQWPAVLFDTFEDALWTPCSVFCFTTLAPCLVALPVDLSAFFVSVPAVFMSCFAVWAKAGAKTNIADKQSPVIVAFIPRLMACASPMAAASPCLQQLQIFLPRPWVVVVRMVKI